MRLTKSFLMLGLTMHLQAQPANTNANVRSISLEESIKMALEHNLEIRIEKYNPQISRFTLEGSYGAYDPAFRSSGSHAFDSREAGGVDQQGRPLPQNQSKFELINADLSGALPTGFTYDLGLDLNHSHNTPALLPDTWSGSVAALTLRQPLLKNFWIDQPRMNIKVNKKNLKISEQGVFFKVMDVATRVEAAYYDLIFAHTNLTVQEKAVELANKLVFENKQKVRIGTMAPLDEKQAESQAAVAQADLLAAKNQLAVQENNLKNLLTDDYANWQSVALEPTDQLVPVPPTFNLMDSWQKGMTKRPDLLQQRLDLEKRDIVLKYSHNQLFPSLDLFGSYGHNGLDKSSYEGVLSDFRDGNNPKYSYGAVFSIPLGNRDARNRYKSSKAEKHQALDRLKKLEQDVMVDIDDAIKVARTNFERIDATRQAREFAEAALDAEKKKLDAGKSTPFVVLQLQRDLTTRRSEEIRAKVDYFKALSQLSFREGSTLERNRLDVEVK